MTRSPRARSGSSGVRPPGSPRTGGLRGRWRRIPRGRRRLLVGLGGTALGVLLAVGAVYAAADIPKPSELDTAQTTLVRYADGSEMLRLQGEQNRTDVPLSDVPEHVRRAVLAAEDRGYYDHSGISLRGIARAVYQDLFGSGPTQGGSTITQQYARNKFLTRHRTVARKFREAIIAVKLERHYSKDQVFEWYLNTIYFGRGAYGIEAASLTYFDVHVRDLTLEQAALLAALIRAPEGGDPAVDRKLAERRWRSVLDGMVEERWLDRTAAADASFPKVRPRLAGGRGRLGGPTGHLSDEVYEELRRHGFEPGEVYTGGLRVTTTIDRKAQEAAIRAVRGVLSDPGKDPNAALVAVEAGTGRIRAMYGGHDFAKRQFNYATDGRRQPGSAFKPVVLAAALDAGVSLRSRYDGRSPQRFGDYEVENFGPGRGEQFGRIDLVEATVHSVNTVYVPLGMKVGVDGVMDTLHELGVPDRVTCDRNRDASLYLGSCVQRPVDMAAVFATFAAQGRRASPYLVEEVRDRNGEVLYRADPKAADSIEADVAADATYAMRQVVERGTATRARIGRPAAGKTGTTSDNTDAWFAGYVPQLATAVWLGYDPPTDADGRPTGPIPPLRNVHGVAEVTGGSLPAEIWARFMRDALQGVPVRDFPPPAFVGDTTTGPTGAPASRTGSPSPLPSVTAVPSATASRPAPTPTATRSSEPPLPSPTDPEPSPSASAADSPAPTPEPTP